MAGVMTPPLTAGQRDMMKTHRACTPAQRTQAGQRETGRGPNRGHALAPTQHCTPGLGPCSHRAARTWGHGSQPHLACGGPSSILLAEGGPRTRSTAPCGESQDTTGKPNRKALRGPKPGPELQGRGPQGAVPCHGRTHEVTRSARTGEAASTVHTGRRFRAERAGAPRASQRPPPKARLPSSEALQRGEGPHTQARAYTHTHTQIHAHTRAQAHALVCAHKGTHRHARTLMHTHTLHTQAHTGTRMHTHTHSWVHCSGSSRPLAGEMGTGLSAGHPRLQPAGTQTPLPPGRAPAAPPHSGTRSQGSAGCSRAYRPC